MASFCERGNYDAHPNLEIMSFEKKVRLYSAFDITIKAAAEDLAKNKAFVSDGNTTPIHFDIKRGAFEESPSLQPGWVEMGDQVLGFFDWDASSPIREASINEVVLNKIERKNIKFFRAKSGESLNESMGSLTINSVVGSWKLFAKDGRPIGGTDQQLYVFKRP